MTRLAAGAALAAVVLAGLACSDLGPPSRSGDVYEWRLVSGPDTLHYQWATGSLPVRFWVEDVNGMPAHLDAALAAWKGAFLYREFDAVVIADSAEADVIVRGTSASGSGVLLARAAECQGATDVVIDVEAMTLELPIRVYVSPRFDPTGAATQRCLGLTTMHEVGHALGVFRHSPDANDIMYFDPQVTQLSERDRATAEVVYHVPPTITATRGQ